MDALPSPTPLTEAGLPGSDSQGSDSSSTPSSDKGVLPPWVPTAAGAAAGGAAAVGAILTMAASGVRPREVWDGVKELLTQRPNGETVSDDQAAYDEALKRLNEEHAQDKPWAGKTNEKGEVYDAAVGWVKKTDQEILTGVRVQKHSETDEVQKALDRVNEEKQKLHDIQEAMRQSDIDWKREELQRLQSQSDKGYNWQDIDHFFRENLARDFKDLSSLDTWKQAGEDAVAWGRDVLIATKDTAWDLVAHMPGSLQKMGNFYHDVVTGLSGWAGEATVDGKEAAKKAWEFGKELAKPVTDIVDPDKPIMDRFAAVAKLEVMTAAGHGMQTGGASVARSAEKLINVAGKMTGIEAPIVTEGGALAGKAAETGAGAVGKIGREEGKRLYGVGMGAIKEDFEQRAIRKLGPGHPAHAIGEINEIMVKEGAGLKPGLVSATKRLDPNTKAYIKGLEVLEKGPGKIKGLNKQAGEAVDAVRHDLDLRSREGALKLMYKEHPELKGTITGFDNTGSHAIKGSNYRILESDIDATPVHNGTVEGRNAARMFPKYYDDAVRMESGGRVGTKQMNAHYYGNNQGQGAYSSKGGLKFKDMLDQTSGRRDVVRGTKITHSVRGDDLIEVGPRTRWTTGSAKNDAVQLHDMRRDAFNKYQQELPGMPDGKERVIQAAKAYKTCRILEAKSVGGRALSEDAELFDKAKAIKGLSGGMSGSEQDALTKQFLDTLKSDANRDLERAL
ncbi:MAG: hypothetical protein V2B13_00340 [Pseudomonadota bacterium]